MQGFEGANRQICGLKGHTEGVRDYSSILPDLAKIVESASDLALQLKRKGLQVELKPDGSLVTNVDKAVEEHLRQALTKLVPGSVVWGEEFGHPETMKDELWLIDPVDGTSNFAFGSPIWGISVALTTPDLIELGAIALPELRETYLAARNKGATMNGKEIEPIMPGPIQPYELVSYNETVIKAHPGTQMPGKMRCSGAAVVDATFAAMQRYRGFIGMNESLYDDAAGMLIAEEAGADVRYANGDPIPIRELRQGGRLPAWLIFPKDSGFFLP